MSKEPIHINVNVDDLLKLTHHEISDQLLTMTIEEVERLESFTTEDLADLMTKNYEQLFKQEFLKKMNKELRGMEFTFSNDQ